MFLKRKLLLLQLQPYNLLYRAQNTLKRDQQIALKHLLVHDEKLSLKRVVFAIEHHVCDKVQRQEQGLRCARLAHDEGRRANAHANEERKRVLPDGIVPSDANLLVELVDNETSDVVVGFSELFTIRRPEEHVVALVHLEPPPQIAAKKAESASRVVCRKPCIPSMSLNNPQDRLCRRVTTTENEIPITRLQNTSKERQIPLSDFPSGQPLTGNPDSQ